MTIAIHDLQSFVALSDPNNRGTSVESRWESALATIKAVVPCDAVTFQIQDVGHRRVLALREWDDAYEIVNDPAGDEVELYWRHFWSSECSYSQRTGDYFTVTRSADHARPPVRNAGSEATPECFTWHEVRVPMPMLGSLDYRLMLWRSGGRDFSERDVLLLSLLRPHLVALRDATFGREPGPRELTGRQRQLLSLMSIGLTNRQAARQLGVSEHTVRKHVENIFERLDVNSRTAAVARGSSAT